MGRVRCSICGLVVGYADCFGVQCRFKKSMNRAGTTVSDALATFDPIQDDLIVAFVLSFLVDPAKDWTD